MLQYRVKLSLEQLKAKSEEIKKRLQQAQEVVEKAKRDLGVAQGAMNRFQNECHHPADNIIDELLIDGPGLRHVPTCQICGAEVRSRHTIA